MNAERLGWQRPRFRLSIPKDPSPSSTSDIRFDALDADAIVFRA